MTPVFPSRRGATTLYLTFAVFLHLAHTKFRYARRVPLRASTVTLVRTMFVTLAIGGGDGSRTRVKTACKAAAFPVSYAPKRRILPVAERPWGAFRGGCETYHRYLEDQHHASEEPEVSSEVPHPKSVCHVHDDDGGEYGCF